MFEIIHMDPKCRAIFLIVCLATFSIIAFSESLQTPKGFSVKLIPWDAVESPHHPGNLTQQERLHQLLMISYARAGWWGLSSNMRPYVHLFKPNYVTEVGFGSRQDYFYLEMDTASDLTWVQGVDCVRCIKVDGGSFRYNESSTFEYIGCDSPNCPSEKCHLHTRCYHEVQYDNNCFTNCDLSSDYLTFPSDDPRHVQQIGPMIFGVGFANVGLFERLGNKIAGVFGLGPGSLSFVRQLHPNHFGSFSYCLPSTEGVSTTLKFGDDAKSLPPGASFQKTPFVPGPNPGAYFLSCTGISVAGVNIQLPTDIFKYVPSRRGGFAIDTGSPITFLHPFAFDSVVQAMNRYFAAYNMKPYIYNGIDYWFTCYRKIQSFEFPTITFHLQGADVNLEYRNIFYMDPYIICLLFRRNSDEWQNSLLGWIAQANKRFLYDLEKNELSVYPEKCS